MNRSTCFEISWVGRVRCATPPGSAGSCVRRPGGFATLNPRLLSVIPAGMGVCDPCGAGGSWARGPGVSLRSTPGYYLPSLRDAGVRPLRGRRVLVCDVPAVSLRSTPGYYLPSLPGWGCATPAGSAGSCVRRPGGFAALNPRLLSVIPAGMRVCDPCGVGGFLCATSRRFRCAQPPATICHPCRDRGVRPLRGRRVLVCDVPGVSLRSTPGYYLPSLPGWGCATPAGSAGSCVRRSGGFAALNPRLLSAIPAGWGCATPPGSGGSCVRRPGGMGRALGLRCPPVRSAAWFHAAAPGPNRSRKS